MLVLSPDGRVHLSSGSWGTISEYTGMWILSSVLYSLWSERRDKLALPCAKLRRPSFGDGALLSVFHVLFLFWVMCSLVYLELSVPALLAGRPLVSSGRGSLSSEGSSLGCSGRWH